MDSEKAKTNKKWTSSAESRRNHDRIFGPKPSEETETENEKETAQEPEDAEKASTFIFEGRLYSLQPNPLDIG